MTQLTESVIPQCATAHFTAEVTVVPGPLSGGSARLKLSSTVLMNRRARARARAIFLSRNERPDLSVETRLLLLGSEALSLRL